MSQAELDASYAWLKQRDAIKAYGLLIALREYRCYSTEEIDHLVKVFNALILARWSDSGLQAIKKGAWKAYEQGQALQRRRL